MAAIPKGPLMKRQKPMRNRNALELRILAHGRDEQKAAEARAELDRRRGNLLLAVVPDWEKALRGPDYSRWETS
jgi:hypothetical protein